MAKKILLLFLFSAVFCLVCNAADIKPISEIKKEDKILILAPHPDDESIGTGGVLQKAIEVGAEIKIVYFTNGDHRDHKALYLFLQVALWDLESSIIHCISLRSREKMSCLGTIRLLG